MQQDFLYLSIKVIFESSLYFCIKAYKNNVMQQVDGNEHKLFYKKLVLWGY